MVFVLASLVFAVVSHVCSAPALTLLEVSHVVGVCAVPMSMVAVAATKKKKEQKKIPATYIS